MLGQIKHYINNPQSIVTFRWPTLDKASPYPFPELHNISCQSSLVSTYLASCKCIYQSVYFGDIHHSLS